MIGSNKEKGAPPTILQKFFTGDIDFIKNKLTRNQNILEVGCGFGRLLYPLSTVSKNVTGIDFSKNQIQKTANNTKQSKNITVRLMRAEKMNFKNNCFDQSICLNNSLGNMPGIEKQVIQEMKRITKAGGKIIVRVFADNTKVRKAQHQNYRRLNFTGIRDFKQAVTTQEGFYSRRFTRKNLQDIFHNCNLKPKIIKDGEAGYIAEATKK
ncbi:MAG: class I SAM-dependent methyltransferase [Candidatus Moranbacteria bacterium]|nr:class I SAM-dependent methyltransferase [Candidatus Moranbacteria bacterium]